MCETCNDTGLTAENHEGTRYPYPCRDCDKGQELAEKSRSRHWQYFLEVRRKVPITN